MRILIQILTVWLFSAGSVVITIQSLAAETSAPGLTIRNEQLLMYLHLPSPEQIAAFYEARGFPKTAIERIRETCFVMAHVENRGKEVLWLELENWRFVTAQGEIQRLDRTHWDTVWDEISLPLANRSTFGWTQLPDIRDLQPNEPVGGNMILPATSAAFTLEADFHTGNNKRKGMIQVRFKDLQCAKDQATP